MGKGKRLGLVGAVIAVMALVVGAAIPALGSSRQGTGSAASGPTATTDQTIRVTAVFTEFDPNIATSALPASALVMRWCSRATC